MSTTCDDRKALFRGLVDDAAMVPPGNASPEVAIAEHLVHRQAWYAELVGPLLVQASRWGTFAAAHVTAGQPPLDVVLIGALEPPGPVPEGVRMVGVELPVASPPLPDSPPQQLLACEIASTTQGYRVLSEVALAHAGGRHVIAKFRTGGTSADTFPDDHALADVLMTAVELGAPLKLTAGLHHAVRRRDPVTGFEHHGFLNVLVAVEAAQAGAPADTVGRLLDERDGARLAALVTGWSVTQVTTVRDGFVSFGCCGVVDPVADLVELGLVVPEKP
ncbi:MAG: hypothetical protein ACR2LE_05775 [Nocardioidaceae bacterium]